ncbi:hypothetical protein [Undibacterium parvum]|uniref:Uncharacterized protein n=2 Tax=Undibacterium TaxID=401469 RepID=A0A6M4A7L0_9BURK|nr:hypothetical protein [Undibacterium parvum]AZP12273.1 hypothetical protein EJN92_09845 [Undibacterium parvum]QJQ06557.1 hypothetical protein EJG51_012710 [Undibacterium piscinae]
MQTMKSAVAIIATFLSLTSAHAINATYAKQLERSGCTQMSELQRCDIKKSRADNAKAGFVSKAPPPSSTPAAVVSNENPYAGNWIAKNSGGATVSTIRIDAKERVWVNDKPAKAKRSDGGLVFKSGLITYRIQGDRRLVGEDIWNDSDTGTQGPIVKNGFT